jgi:hypothetical protein
MCTTWTTYTIRVGTTVETITGYTEINFYICCFTDISLNNFFTVNSTHYKLWLPILKIVSDSTWLKTVEGLQAVINSV